MDVRFLRDEAARFRGMAEDADREATKLRLLAMAVDYDARANAAANVAKPRAEETSKELIEPEAEGEDTASAGPGLTGTLSVRPVRKAKETVVVERRPVGRPRRE